MSEVCPHILEDREGRPFVVIRDKICNLDSDGTIFFAATLLKQLSRLLSTVSTLKINVLRIV